MTTGVVERNLQLAAYKC